MAKPKRQNDTPLLFPLSEQAPEGPLSLAVTPHPLRTLDAQTPNNVTSIASRLDAQRATGRPVDAQTSVFDSSEECRFPSRIKTMRPNVRLDADLMQTVANELKTRDRPPKISRVIEDGLRLWLQRCSQDRVDAQASTGSSCSSSGFNDLDQENIKTTTTTTVDAQTPKAVMLPGVAASIANLPRNSRHEFETLLAYAWESYNKGDGIKAPDVWAASNYRTGKGDMLVDLWVDRKNREEEDRQRRHAARTAEAERQRLIVEQIEREREEETRRCEDK